MKSRILITGGTGLLALNWAYQIRDSHEVILGLHSRSVKPIFCKSTMINLESVDAIVDKLKALRIHIVIHTVGLTNVEACEENPELAYHVNVELAVNIAAACMFLNIQLVHISTDHLFSGGEKFNSEECTTNPVNIYAKSKKIAEVAVLNQNPSALVIRTNFFCWGTSYRNSLSDFIINNLRKNEPLYMFRDVYFTPIIATELARVVHEILAKGGNGIYNIVSEDRLSKHEFALKIAKAIRCDEKLMYSTSICDKKDLVLRPLEMSLSNKKTEKLLGRSSGNVDQFIKISAAS